MTWSVELDVSQYAYGRPEPVLVRVEEVDPRERFTDALSRVLEPLIGADDFREAVDAYDMEEWGTAWWFRLGEDPQDRMPIWTGPTLTVREMRNFLGEKPERLHSAINIGAPEPFPIVEAIWELVGTGLTLNEIRKLVFHSGYSAVYHRIYAADWKAFADWKHTGAMTIPLQQAGRSERNWDAKMLARRFGASSEDARRFMHELGYVPAIDYDGSHYWTDPATD